jgi:gliding motility-associated-like protein
MRCDTFVLPPVPVQGQNINATDLCSPVISINTSTVSTQNPDPTHCQHYSYHYTRTFTATDECGNTQTATQIISVIDNQPPVPGGVLDTTALCSVLTPFPAPVPLAMDLCGGMTPPPVPLDTIIIPGVCAGNYTIQKVWQARDFCFNSVVFNQFIHVIDTVAPQLSNIPPGITVECDGIPIPPDTNGFNGTDNCAAGVTVTLTESEIRNPDTTNCSHWNNYIVRREWTASDDCGNLRTYSQDIMVVDITPPAMVAPPAIVLPNDPGDCGVSIPLPAPISIFDKCTSGRASALVKDTMAITPLTPPFSGTIPVDTIVFQVAPPNSLPAEPAISNVTAIVFIEKADADGVTEYFRFFGENSFFLGNTGPTPGLCSSIPGIDTFTFSAAQFNSWAADGSLTFTFAPNGSFGAAINPTCTDSRIRLHLIYDYATPSVPVELTYSLDGAAPANFPPPGDTYLPVGTHTLVYTASDCAENSSTASVQITVNDVEAPSIAAPAPIVSYVSNGACMDTIVLPFPVITENCKMSGNINKSSIFNQIQFIDDPDFGNIPASVTMNIPGLIPNAITGGTLSFKFKGDNSNPREFFNIFHGITPVISTNINASHAGSCLDTVLTSLPITPAQINLWAANGNAVFRAEPNTFPAGVPLDFDFINPCGGLLPGSSWDGVSIIQAMIEYNYAIINFKITRNSPSMIVATGAVQGTQTMVPNLSPGAYTIEYTTTDQAGLIGTTTFPLTVLDTIKPVAKCKPQLFIEINPSGLNNYVLQPFEINNNSTDNCPGTLSYSLSQSVFTCQAAGTSNQVVLTVTDAAGNISTCSTTVFAQMDAPAPSNSAVCEGDTLFLLANPPTPGNFLYNWTGPAFTSTIQNPIRPNALPSYQGQYTVQITGSTGCTASGSVTVNFANLSQPIFSVSGGNGTNFCQGQSVTLNASFSMGNVSYLWYQVGSPADILLGTTSLNFFTLPNLAPGQYSFYVKVKVGDCLTPNSLAIVVNVFARPTASVVDNFIQICAGQPLGLSTNETGVSYYWEGPLGWTSTVQHPLVMAAVTEMEEGFYTLTTTQNGCASIPVAIVQVDVKYTPPKPIITGDGLVCSGQDVLLTANVASQFFPLQYLWQDFPSVPVPTGQINTLQLNDITPADCGFWRVRATYENCPSEWSDEAEVCAENYPDVTAASNSPICQDSMLNLMATGSSGIVEWSWILPDNSIIYTQNPSITPGQPGIYRAVVKTLYECTDTATIIVAGSIAPIISNLEVIAPICENGSPAILIPTISSLNSPFTYFWTHNGTTLSFPSPTYVIAPYGPANNGAYTLVVKDSLGCPSIPQTTLLNVQAYVPTPQIVITDNFVCVGETVELKLDSVYNGSPTFYWIGPQNDTTVTTSAQLFLNNIQLSQEGNYTVFVQVGDCFSSNSIFATLTVNPIPAVPSIGNIEPVCSGDDLHLFVDPELPGTNYHWTGPGYNVTAISPVRTNMTEAQEGNYFVQAEQAGCFSGKDTAFVFVMALPKNPLILTTDPSQICIEPINPNAFIRVSLSTQTINGLYTWINPASGDTLWGPSSDFTLNFIDLAPQFQLPGLHQFSVLTWLPDNAAGSGCSSMVSPSFSVQFDTVPNNQALCADDHKACSAKPILLEATDPSGTLTGMWNQIGAPLVLITNPDSSTARFNGVAGTTYTFVWSISNGGCVNFSSDTIQIMVAPPEQSFAGADTAICDGSNFMLNAKDGVNVPGIWSQLNQFVTIVDSLESKTPITGLIPGMTYYFVWTLGDIGCGLSIDTVEVRYYSQKPDIDWINNEALCSSSNQVFLNIKDALANFEFGKWSKIPGTPLEFQNPNSTQTEVYELTPGLNTVYFTINDGVCGNNSRDTAVINYQIIPLANNDFANVDFGGSVSINVLTNDALPPNGTPISVYILPPGPLHGEIIDTFEIGSFVYKPDAGYSGSDEFSYRVCNNICGTDNCPTATVSINVGAAGNCFVPTIITPNNDGLNDFFQLPPECYISGEGQLGAVEVTVFNQWGDYVFHSLSTEEPSGIIVWDGKYNGKQLPASTYYYIVKFEGDQTPKSGFLLIQY